MSIITIQLMIQICCIISAILLFSFLVIVGNSYHPEKMVYKTFERVNNRLREKKSGFFDYEQTEQFLSSNGAAFHFGTWINPIRFLFLRVLIAILLFPVGMQIHPVPAIVLIFVGYNLPSILLVYLNKNDNMKMMEEIQKLYNLLQVQIRSGVYVSNAIAESYRSFQRGRLKVALEQFSNEIFMNSSFEESLETFNKKFNNGLIDSLCVILMQAQESGQAIELLRDVHQQIDGMRASLLLKKKEKLDRVTTLCLLGILAAFLICVLFVFGTQIVQTAGSL